MNSVAVRHNSAIYEFVLTRMVKSYGNSDYSEASAWASIAGQCAWRSHAGFYADAQVENILLDMGRKLEHKSNGFELEIASKNNHLKVLHVLSVALPVGGHTRLVERWICNRLRSSESHSVLVLDQGYVPVPRWIESAVASSGGSFILLPDGASIDERALQLRKVAHAGVDLVILHTNPNDPIPLLAFSTDGGPPVLLFNHADHVFWYGSSIADLVIDIRPVGQDLSFERRGIECSLVLPIPLLPKGDKNREMCRNELNIPRDKIVLLSVATSYKFKSYEDLDFVKVFSEFIEKNKNVFLVVVGPSQDDVCWSSLTSKHADQFLLCGVVDNIDDYYGAADIYIESFPLGSLTSALDAALYGLPVIQAPKPVLPILVLDQYPGMQGNASDFFQYFNMISQCVNDEDHRISLGRSQKASVERIHLGDGWSILVDRLMDSLPACHSVSSIGVASKSLDGTDAAWAKIQSASTDCDRGGLLTLINSIRANSKYIAHTKMFVLLISALILFGVPRRRFFLVEILKTFISISCPRCLYKRLRNYYQGDLPSKLSTVRKAAKTAPGIYP